MHELLALVVLPALEGGVISAIVMYLFYWYLIRQELKELDEIKQLHAEVDLNLANSKKLDDELTVLHSKAETLLEDITQLRAESEDHLKTCREILFDMTTDHDPALVELTQQKNQASLNDLSERMKNIYGD